MVASQRRLTERMRQNWNKVHLNVPIYGTFFYFEKCQKSGKKSLTVRPLVDNIIFVVKKELGELLN